MGISEICILLPFLLLSRSTCLLFVCRSWKRIKDIRKKTRILLNSNFIWGLTTILCCGMFSWTSRNSHISPDKTLKYIIESSSTITSYPKVQPLLYVAGRWQRVVSGLCRQVLRSLVGSPKADWSSTQRYSGRNPAKGALVKIQEVSVPATSGLESLCQCVCGKSASNRAFFRVGLGTLPAIQSQSIFFNEQHGSKCCTCSGGSRFNPTRVKANTGTGTVIISSRVRRIFNGYA